MKMIKKKYWKPKKDKKYYFISILTSNLTFTLLQLRNKK